MTKNAETEKNKKKPSRKKILLIIICIFLAAVVLFGAIFGIIVGVKNAKAVVSFNGIRLTEGECRYLAATYKYSFLSEYAEDGAIDDSYFWNSKYESDKTYGDLLSEKCEEYIRNVTVAAYIFDSYCKMTSDDKRIVKTAVRGVLNYKADGSEDKFNSIAEPFGFTFKDFESVATVLYKSRVVMTRIYGVDGSNMQSFPAECEEFFKTYSHVKLLNIRTEDRFSLDSSGNIEIDKISGEPVRIALSESEKAERKALIAEIEASIDALENGGDNRMTSKYFDYLLTHNDEGEANRRNTGYYFSESSEYSARFSKEAYPEIVEKSLEMKIGSYARVDLDRVVCFIYKYANTDGAYTDTSEDGFFADFYALAAEHSFYNAVTELVGEVKVKDKFYGIDVVKMTYNYDLIPRF